MKIVDCRKETCKRMQNDNDLSFLDNCVCDKQKKTIKDQREFPPNAFFKVLANFVTVHSEI